MKKSDFYIWVMMKNLYPIECYNFFLAKLKVILK